jgi:mono/diheme cytochrome c family protein
MLSCNTSNKENYLVKKEHSELSNAHPGKELMETNCNVCHSPTVSHDNRLGPPMIAVKKHYIDADTSKEVFIDAIQRWLKNPNEEDAKMFGAVKRFGVMPKQNFSEETIALIAEYLYDYDIEQPEWFEGHHKNEKRKGMHKGMH